MFSVCESRALCLKECSNLGLTLEYDPPGSGNQCFYQCLGEHLKCHVDDVVELVEGSFFKIGISKSEMK